MVDTQYIMQLFAFISTCCPLVYSKLHSSTHSIRIKFIYWWDLVSDALKPIILKGCFKKRPPRPHTAQHFVPHPVYRPSPVLRFVALLSKR